MSETEIFTQAPFQRRVSPNHEPRRLGPPDLIVLHYTAMRTAQEACARLCDPAAKVSAHYLIGEDGGLWALVPENMRAWHAGVAHWGAQDDVNSRSIGVELANWGGEDQHRSSSSAPPFPEAQMNTLEALLRDMMGRWGVSPRNVLAHSDVAPGRKLDPGLSFDWRRLARQGLARPIPTAQQIETQKELLIRRGDAQNLEAVFRDAAMKIGYGDWPLKDLLDATRRRFSPARMNAPFTLDDTATLTAIAAQ